MESEKRPGCKHRVLLRDSRSAAAPWVARWLGLGCELLENINIWESIWRRAWRVCVWMRTWSSGSLGAQGAGLPAFPASKYLRKPRGAWILLRNQDKTSYRKVLASSFLSPLGGTLILAKFRSI